MIAGNETTRGTAAHFVQRHSPPVMKFRRTVMADTEIGPQRVAKGAKIYDHPMPAAVTPER